MNILKRLIAYLYDKFVKEEREKASALALDTPDPYDFD